MFKYMNFNYRVEKLICYLKTRITICRDFSKAAYKGQFF